MGTVKRVIAKRRRRRRRHAPGVPADAGGYSFRYVMTDPYRAELPEVTSAKRAGDCKVEGSLAARHLEIQLLFTSSGRRIAARRAATRGFIGSRRAAGGFSIRRIARTQSPRRASPVTVTCRITLLEKRVLSDTRRRRSSWPIRRKPFRRCRSSSGGQAPREALKRHTRCQAGLWA
jgi:hypothetical protein